MALDCEVFTDILISLRSSVARVGVPEGAAISARPLVLSPYAWLGALLLAAALVVLGHATASADDQPDLLTAVATTADSVAVNPVTGTLMPVVGAATTQPLAPADPIVQALAPAQVVDSGWPLLQTLTGTTVAPLSGTLRAVGGVLPAPVGAVAQDVADSLPAPAPAEDSAAPTAPAPPARHAAEAAGPALPQAHPERPTMAPVATWSPSSPASGGAAPAPSDPTSPWSPGQPPSLPVGGTGAGGSSSLTAGFGASSLAWAAVLTLLLALVTLARARLAAPLALRSAMHASRMRRPG